MNDKLVLAAALALTAAPVLGQGFTPTRPVEVVVHTGPGGGSDVLARAVALMMEKEKLLPVRMQVANKTGGGGAGYRDRRPSHGTMPAAGLARQSGGYRHHHPQRVFGQQRPQQHVLTSVAVR